MDESRSAALFPSLTSRLSHQLPSLLSGCCLGGFSGCGGLLFVVFGVGFSAGELLLTYF